LPHFVKHNFQEILRIFAGGSAPFFGFLPLFGGKGGKSGKNQRPLEKKRKMLYNGTNEIKP
jgi:hypothetical protein